MATIQQAPDSEAITLAEWSWVEGLIRDVSREGESNTFARKVFQLDLAMQQFRKLEQRRIVLGSPTSADLDLHARCLEGLLTIGRALVLGAGQFQPEELARFGIKHGELSACVEDLEQSFREWHHGFSQEALEKVRAELFSSKA